MVAYLDTIRTGLFSPSSASAGSDYVVFRNGIMPLCDAKFGSASPLGLHDDLYIVS